MLGKKGIEGRSIVISQWQEIGGGAEVLGKSIACGRINAVRSDAKKTTPIFECGANVGDDVSND